MLTTLLNVERHLIIQELTLRPSGEWQPETRGWTVSRVAEGVGYSLQGPAARELNVGDMDVVRRVTLQSTLHSFPLQQRINIDAWIEQEDESDAATQAAEMVMTSMPYAARRLRLLREFAESPDLLGCANSEPCPIQALAAGRAIRRCRHPSIRRR